MQDDGVHSATEAMIAIDAIWSEVKRSPFVLRDLGEPIDRLPDIGEGAALARSARAKAILRRIETLDAATLPADMQLTLAVARETAERIAREGEWYWLVFDPLGVGFFAMFAPTAYGGGFLLNFISGILSAFRFETPGDVDRYLGLIEDYGRLVGQLAERTEGQASRGIYMPQVQLAQAIELVQRLRDAASASLVPSIERLVGLGGEQAVARCEQRLLSAVRPAFDRLHDFIAASAYRASAPEVVGIAQYPGGSEVYAELVRQHTTLDLSPHGVHEEGLKRMAAIAGAIDRLLAVADFKGSARDYLAAIAEDKDWRVEDVAGAQAVFRRYIDRIAPHIDAHFNFKPVAAHDVAPLPAALSGSMTFGFYEAPAPDKPIGRYLFNADNVIRNSVANIAALNYHELVPGHHFHLASQRENTGLHPLRSNAFFNAFNEGWAEYAASLAGEMGMYEAPEERFGRLMMDSFLTCRLVVDTGMNALGWSLDQARDYMRANALISETEVISESIRYSCDIPGQSLGYKIGEHFLMARREEMRTALGDAFDIRDFHDAVLKPGGLPLHVVAGNVAAATQAAHAAA